MERSLEGAVTRARALRQGDFEFMNDFFDTRNDDQESYATEVDIQERGPRVRDSCITPPPTSEETIRQMVQAVARAENIADRRKSGQGQQRIMHDREEAPVQPQQHLSEAEKQRRHELMMLERQYEEAERQRQHELELTKAKQAGGDAQAAPRPSFITEKTRLPGFDENKDDLDDFLKRFERVARMQSWDDNTWATRLSTCLSGKALMLYNALPDEVAENYVALSRALRERFRLDAETYRQKLRRAKIREGETSEQYLARLGIYLQRWIGMANKEETFEDLVDLLLMEQLLSGLRSDMSIFIKQREPTSANEIVRLMTLYKRSTDGIPVAKEGGHHTRPERPASGPGLGPPGLSRGSQHLNQQKVCFYCKKPGHLKKDCRQRWRDSPRIQFVSTLDVNGEENVCSIPELCIPCSRKRFQPRCQVKIDGRPGEGLRDTGADVIVVRASLVAPKAYTGRTYPVTLAETTCKYEVATAIVNIDTPLFAGRVEAVVMENPPCDLLIGNKARLVTGEIRDIPVYRIPIHVAAVTREQAQRAKKPLQPLKTAPAPLSDIRPAVLAQHQREDTTLIKLWEAARTGLRKKCGKRGTAVFCEEKKLLYRKFNNGKETHHQVIVPKQHREMVMRLGHETILAGHMAARRTLDRIWRQFYWPGMCAEIRRFCQSCDQCQRTTSKGSIKKVPLQKMPFINEPFKRVGVDLVGPITPASDDGNRYILTMVDFATRYPEAVPLKSIESTRVAEALLTMWTRLGIPAEVLTDRGTQFTSDVMAEIERLLSIRHLFTTPYHAQCNGLVERFNGTLKSMLRKLSQEKPKTWDRYIPALLFAYREVPQESLGFSPFELLYGRQVRGPMSVLRQAWTDEQAPEEVQTTAAYVVELRNRIQETCQLAQDNLRKAAGRYAVAFNRKAKPRYFKVGQRVLLLLPQHHNKLQLQWQGPYTVTARIGEADYRIRVGDRERLFHANLLRLYVERTQTIPGSLTVASDDAPADTGVTPATTVAVVIEEEETKLRTDGVPTLHLVQKETLADVKISSKLSEDQRNDVNKVLAPAARIFSDKPLRTELELFKFDLMQQEPVRTKAYPVPYAQREVIDKEVQDMLRLGVIEPASSPYNSPIVLVKKKNGDIRFCVDYRRLNKITVFDAEPLPDPEYLFSKLARARYFTKIDLAKGYWAIAVAEEDRPKTAFTTPNGQFQWGVMPFGLQNAGAVFTRMMRRLLEPLGLEDVSHFIDDILIASLTWRQQIRSLGLVLQRLNEANLAARPSKCFIGFEELAFLGHVVGNGQISPEEDKVEKIRKAERPRTKKNVRSFLGLASYYRKFIPHFAAIALPLTSMTKKLEPSTVVWSSAAETAFQTLKERLTSSPILRLPDLSVDFVFRTDASDAGLGGVLMQNVDDELHPVCYASRKLSSAEANYATVEKECLAAVWAVKKFEVFLYGRHFTLQTDHQPLKYLQQARQTNGRLMRWALLLQPYRFTIQVIAGKDNVGADFLSRATYQ